MSHLSIAIVSGLKSTRRKAAGALLLGGALILSACATTPQAPAPVGRPQQPLPEAQPLPETPKVETPDAPEAVDPNAPEAPPPLVTKQGLTPPHMAGRPIKRVALLLPFSSASARLRDEAAAMLQGAEMAVFDQAGNDVLLMALDTAGTPEGARSAASSAVSSGADVILGPLLAPAVSAAADIARRANTPILAFSTDQSVAGRGVYLLSFPPEAEVEQVTAYAAEAGARNFALLGPDSEYARRVDAAYKKAVEGVGGNYTVKKTYQGSDISVMQEPARALAQAYKAGSVKFDAILLPEGGTALRSLGPLLPYYDINPGRVQFMGTGLWNREDTMREPALRGGIFAGPDPQARKAYEADFKAAYNTPATKLSSLAYDGVSIAANVIGGDPRKITALLTDPEGFYGVDGLVRFRANGTPQRGLAIYEVKPGRFDIIAPAPRTASELGSGS